MYDIKDPKERKIVDDQFRQRRTKQRVDRARYQGMKKPSPRIRKKAKRR